MKLINKDLSDIPLTGNPQITFFTSVYRRFSKFWSERIRLEEKPPDQDITIPHYGHLIESIDLEISEITYPPTLELPDNIGTTVLQDITLFVDSKFSEKLSGSYIEIYYQLNNTRSLHSFYKKDGNNHIVCDTGNLLQNMSLSGGVYNHNKLTLTTVDILRVILPIPFSFSSKTSNSFPYVLFHSTSPLKIRFTSNPSFTKAKFNFILNYIFLSEEEYGRFKLSKNEYIIEQVKEVIINFSNEGYHDFPIPNIAGNIKSIIWKNPSGTNLSYNISINDNLLFFEPKSYHYFTKHNIRRYNLIGGGRKLYNGSLDKYIISDDSIAIYTFGLESNNNDTPTGTINSNKNNVSIKIHNITTPKLHITLYIISYNILTITDEDIKINYIN